MNHGSGGVSEYLPNNSECRGQQRDIFNCNLTGAGKGDLMVDETEAPVKKQVAKYLAGLMKLGVLYYDRLNSGHIVLARHHTMCLCRNGTADFFVLTRGKLIFLECKRPKGGHVRPEQGEFKALVEAQGAAYHLVRGVDDVDAIIQAALAGEVIGCGD